MSYHSMVDARSTQFLLDVASFDAWDMDTPTRVRRQTLYVIYNIMSSGVTAV
jgi:hypothetical protein